MKGTNRSVISVFDLKKPGVKLGYSCCYALAAGLAVLMIYPLLWVLFGSLKEANEIFLVPPTLLPKTFLFQNYREAWQIYEIPKVVANTFIAFGGFLLVRFVVISAAAYALSHLKIPFRTGFYMIFLATLMLPFFAYIIPAYLVVFQLGLLNTFWAVWLPAGADSFTLLLLKGFFDGIPGELFEAARIDGASELKILRVIVLPLAKPILAALTIFAFMAVWNNFLWQQIVLSSGDKWTISVALWFRSLGNVGATVAQNIQLAAMLISTIPPMIVFLFFQKYIIEGVTFSGIKG
ncbi:carbohydrate ABC transporter membrane protein 2 (CUT1 family) [Hydrogenispora ethanolica]|jgi:ABC-type glycerol-3-phosphate transport system permease component|uniref:Carbohydrate ABC transporter membrane protein 2 (CUT1 family) n=1 Tax=Hydrogenispora ethanolica TaxID=1082276 RepID=A0A4V2QEL7_HYDET|nr:carbohydrate ABC transporter permease [Hydrogenispora ethanolica]TCL68547.1 carbohydrate ABC transporter membrane protein 2 (CUT1 family) [Hydrogenispora ethanolica]